MALTRITKGVIKPNENYDTHNINSTGVITATAFNGDGSSLTGVANTDFVVGTAITMVSANFTGNVSIAGTLTYEDVTNVDSVGIVTARTGIRVTGGAIGINSATPNTSLDVIQSSASRTWTPGSSVISMFERSGHCRIALVAGSSSYSSIDFGDSSNDNSGYIKYDHSDNSMSFRTNGNVIDKLRITDDGKVGIGTTNPTGNLHISSGTSGDCQLIIESDTDDSDENDNPRIIFKQDGGVEESAIEQLNNQLTISNSVVADGGIILKTGSTNGYTNAVERIRITSDGRIGINKDNPNNYELDIWKRTGVTDAQIRLYNDDTGTSSDTVMRFQIAGTTANNYIYFGDSGDANAGQIRYNHASNYMSFHTNGTEQMRITSTGAITKPNNPSAFVFEADGPGGNNAVTSGSQDNVPIHFDHSSFSKGGMTISNSNSRFTIPVDGVYFVSGTIAGDCDVLSAGDGWEFHILKNGVQVQNNYEPIFSVGSSVGQEYSVTVTRLMDLNDGDYIELAIANIDSAQGTVNRGSFSAFLVG